MKFIRTILFPFSIIYGWIMNLRNNQFDSGQRRQTKFDRPVISVGNLSVGGTGKTPMIEYLIRLFKDDYQLATISRGYGRKTKGFKRASAEDDAATIGDEPYQFYKKFGDEMVVSVCEERILAIPSLLLDDDSLNLFLLDDAYQHRQMGRDFNIMLSDFNEPFYKDFVLPTGNLREPRKGASRADAIIITKCPMHLEDIDKDNIKNSVRIYNSTSPIYFSSIKYLPIRPVFNAAKAEKEIGLLTGVAKAGIIADYLSANHHIKEHLEYPDHYRFRANDLSDIGKKMKEKDVRSLVTTEKDMVRLLPFKDHPVFSSIDLYYLPIAFEIDRKEEFQEQLMKVVEKVN
ncbi:tetraacyldisaccharide 4'-kinase [Roseivirga sp.]|uniref:tetraacyldisaccharide 4'-kinase n=1 Tax=Roseivirga sp. TaxID=1964215 RepID=UPI003B8C0B80